MARYFYAAEAMGRRMGPLPTRAVLAATVMMALLAQPVFGQPRRSPARLLVAKVPKHEKADHISDYVPGQLIVGFKPSATAGNRAATYRATGSRLKGRIPDVGATVVELPRGQSVRAGLRAFEREPAVAWVVPNMRMRRDEVVPTDPLFPEQWGLMNVAQSHQIADPPPSTTQGLTDADIDASDAWSTTTGSSETVVAIIDSGIDATHPDLLTSLWSNPDELPGNGLDDDANGYVDDTYGWDFIENDNVPQDIDGHGTHLAGIIAAGINNGVGGTGVCPGCRLMILRAENVVQELTSITYAIDNGADIINASYGYDFFLEPEWLAFRAAYEAGILVVAAAGNAAANDDMSIGDLDKDGQYDAPLFPAAFDLPGIISVAASNDYDQYGYATGCYYEVGKVNPCFFTNFGHDSVDLAAPGVDIMTTSLASSSTVVDGTSFSAPMVVGVAGLVKSVHPEYDVIQLRNAVLNSVDHPADLGGGWTATSGRVNAATALAASPTTAIPLSMGNVPGASPISGFVRGRLNYPTNINDVFRVRLRRGLAYEVVLGVPEGKDFDLYVWKPDTVQIWQVEPGCDWVGPCHWLLGSSTRGRGKYEALGFKARKAGTYYIQVTSWYSSGRYSLIVGRV